MNRRRFLQAGTALAASAALPNLHQAQQRPSPADRIRIGIVGVAGQGGYNLANVAHEEIVALCDVDLVRAASVRQQFPRARFYEDYRQLIDQRDVDAVVISIPDHMHAFVGLAALRAGKHVYCEKPLAHSVHEVRLMREVAARQGVVTQMGTQIHAGENYRRVVEIVQAGTLGAVRRVHVWCSRRPDPGQRAPAGTLPPVGLNYDLWLGPAPYRPYHPSHLHFNWRWWWAFGGGVLADMACHFMDLPHWALDLRAPTSVAAEGRVIHQGDNRVPTVMKVDYEYPARGNKPPVNLTWYHGVAGPNLDGRMNHPGFSSGVLFEGERGSLVADYGNYRLLPEDRFRDYRPPAPTLPRSIGHHREWLQAIRTRGPTTCNFDYSGALAEAVLLGNVAFRCGQRLQWNEAAAQVSNTRAADQYLQREYRRGWTL
jgi:predicted dehydrogenase